MLRERGSCTMCLKLNSPPNMPPSRVSTSSTPAPNCFGGHTSWTLLESEAAHFPPPSPPHKKRKLAPSLRPTGSFLLRRCSTCARLRSCSRFSPHLPSRRTTAPRLERRGSPVRDSPAPIVVSLLYLLTHLHADPNQECTPYYYAPVGNAIHNFPPVWVPATLLANDSQGQALWAKISASIPTNILPKGQIN